MPLSVQTHFGNNVRCTQQMYINIYIYTHMYDPHMYIYYYYFIHATMPSVHRRVYWLGLAPTYYDFSSLFFFFLFLLVFLAHVSFLSQGKAESAQPERYEYLELKKGLPQFRILGGRKSGNALLDRSEFPRSRPR